MRPQSGRSLVARRLAVRGSALLVLLGVSHLARADGVTVYQNGFESADTCAWKASVPASTCDPTMVYVPAGEFTMGSSAGELREQPVHLVYLDAFWIDRTEVTVDAYAACVASGVCKKPNSEYGESFPNSPWCNWGAPDRAGDHPVNCLEWGRANKYCAWAGKRLPTEAEWEKAARGTDARTYPWGEAEPSCDYAIIYASVGGNGCGFNTTWPVGSKPAGVSPYGALDMSGNVWEWVNDWYLWNYYTVSPHSNPPGPAKTGDRVLRGNSWDGGASSSRAAYRNGAAVAFFSIETGFRCAASTPPAASR
ncbi:MAG: SUMF1/EgtB/PvdO family nonheme iron enzyme [bacterium]